MQKVDSPPPQNLQSTPPSYPQYPMQPQLTGSYPGAQMNMPPPQVNPNMSPPQMNPNMQMNSYPSSYPMQQQQQPTGPPVVVVQQPGFQNPQVGQAYRDQLFAQCAMGVHNRRTEYGIGGIIAAIVCFPIGLIFLLIDKHDKCTRCGIDLGN